LAPDTGGGLVIGAIQHGARMIFVYGAAKEDSIFEIGSISKTFTGLILARMVGQQKVTLDEPVRQLLPEGTVAKPNGPEITLLDLASQHSGLPRMPDNFHPGNPEDPTRIIMRRICTNLSASTVCRNR
jgi:serine-type D-Ala-D-Ala carboxypeptidase/endopeptidase